MRLFLLSAFFLSLPFFSFAQNNPDFPPDEFYLGKIISISDPIKKEEGGFLYSFETVLVEFLSGPEKGKEVSIERGGELTNDRFRLSPGSMVVVSRLQAIDEISYYIDDVYRLPSLGWIFFIFIILTIIFAQKQGFSSLLGLVVCIGVIGWFIVPEILKGTNPFLVSLVGVFGITVVSFYLAHGFKKRTSIALIGTLITLALAALLSILFVSLSSLFGFGSEEAFFLQVSHLQNINLRGLLLGGILIGALGVLDDVTTSQSAAVEEISKADPSLSLRELYYRGLSVGREHIASLVNTLVLAYTGASLPLFLIFYKSEKPLWYLVNSEVIAEEIVRALLGSTALVLAVPITTYLAARAFCGTKSKDYF